MSKKFFLLFLFLFLLSQIPILMTKLPQEREGWLSDISYNLNTELTGSMVKDIPWGSTWSSGRGKSFYLIHHVFYKIFGIGVFQGRMVTFLFGLLLLFFVFKWAARHLSHESALLSTLLLALSFSFWPFLPVVSQDMIHCLLLFGSFYLLYNAISLKRGIYYFAAGLVSALAVENSYRGISVVMSVYIIYALFSNRETFLKHALYLLGGSLATFLFWFSLNILPMGLDNFIHYHILASRTERNPHLVKMLLNEVNRLFLFIRSQKHLAKFEMVYSVFLLILFYKYRLKLKYPYISKYILSWLCVTFIVMSVVSQLDMQITPNYMLSYSIFICLLCGLSLSEFLKRRRKMAMAFLTIILLSGMGYSAGRLILYSQYYKKGHTLTDYFEKISSRVDLTKNILGDVEFWYAFPNSQYYGGVFYLGRLNYVLHELKSADHYASDEERATAILNVLKKRNIEYIVSSTEKDYLKDNLSAYFPNHELPERNFKLIHTVDNRSLWSGHFQQGPSCHYFVEVYRIASYD